jgi:hypothetical protein
MSHLLPAERGVLGRPSYAGDGVSPFSSSASGAGPAGAGSGAGAGETLFDYGKEALDAFVSQREADFASFQQQQREMLIRQYKLVMEGLDAKFNACQTELRSILNDKFDGLVTTHLDLSGPLWY